MYIVNFIKSKNYLLEYDLKVEEQELEKKYFGKLFDSIVFFILQQLIYIYLRLLCYFFLFVLYSFFNIGQENLVLY